MSQSVRTILAWSSMKRAIVSAPLVHVRLAAARRHAAALLRIEQPFDEAVDMRKVVIAPHQQAVAAELGPARPVELQVHLVGLVGHEQRRHAAEDVFMEGVVAGGS